MSPIAGPVSLGMALLLIFLALCGGLVATDLTHPGEETAHYLPSTTPVYATFNLRPGLDQLLKLKEFINNYWNNPDIKSDWDEASDWLDSELRINFQTEVFPWLGPEIALGVRDLISGCPEWMGPEYIALIGTMDKQASQAAFDNWIGRWRADVGGSEEEIYRGIVIYENFEQSSANPPCVRYRCYAHTDEYILVAMSDLPLVHQTIDLILDGGPSLWDDSNFQAARAKLPQQRVGMLYCNLETQVLPYLLDQGYSTQMATSLASHFPPYAAASLSFAEGGKLKLDVHAPTQQGILSSVAGQAAPLDTARLAPGDTLLFFSLQNPGLFWQEISRFATELGFMSSDFDDRFQDDFGFSLGDDVFSWMTGEVGYADMNGWFVGHGYPRALFYAEIEDQDLVTQKLNKLFAALQNAGASVETQEVTLESDADGTMHQVPATLVSIEDVPFTPGYLFLGNYLVVGSSEYELRSALDAYFAPETSLAQNPDFQAVVSSLSPERTWLGYFNIYGWIDQMLFQAEIYGDAEGYAEIARFTDPLRAFALSNLIGQDDTTLNLNFQVRAEEITTGRVMGRIFLEDYYAPTGEYPSLAGISIDIDGRRTITDPDGRFIVSGITPGSHTLTATTPNFLPVSKTITVGVGRIPQSVGDAMLWTGNPVADDCIDILDLAAVAASFNTRVSTYKDGDLNGDDLVDIYDLVQVGKRFGMEGPISWDKSLPWTKLVLKADLGHLDPEQAEACMKVATEIIQHRLDSYGGTTSVVIRQGADSIIIAVPRTYPYPLENMVTLVTRTGHLDFREQADGKWVMTDLTSDYLLSAQVVTSPLGQTQIRLQFNPNGSELLEEITRRNIDKPLGIFLDGELWQAPTVRAVISGGWVVIGGFYDEESAKVLAAQLNSGALPILLSLQSVEMVWGWEIAGTAGIGAENPVSSYISAAKELLPHLRSLDEIKGLVIDSK